MSDKHAKVILLCGPPGSGKTWLCSQSRLPVLRLDDFFKNGDDPTLPRIRGGHVDWDSADAWHLERALDAIRQLCSLGVAEVPVYDMTQDRAVGQRRVDIGNARFFVAEGVFAAHLIEDIRTQGLLADALVLQRSRWRTMVRRTRRDLREKRKRPWIVISRSLRLLRQDRTIVADRVRLGARPVTMTMARAYLAALR